MICSLESKGKPMSEEYREEILHRLIKNLLDIQILRMVKTEPIWGYMIKKKAEQNFNIKLRHGALYPMLNDLEKRSFLSSERQTKDGRVRKVYSITNEGKEYLQSYYNIIQEQINIQN